ncbi:hypothetical protein J5N97_027909 [Dioscorea zingiberensis]|uniref:Uncharacterized protein n=1 Tax=Dioscorea zingiberensis TaxID=325984 RepID=A0A9D5BYH3_9LILI|nr:hypothetical protein J5N97_027909 [Dioscorea zingiberensis]
MDGAVGCHGLPTGFAVVVVDDDLASLKAIERMLLQRGYKVSLCNGSNEALSTLQENYGVFDLVITEVHLSGLSGLELISRAKSDFKLPVISMCSHVDPGIMSQALSQGASFHLTKPLTDASLETIWQYAWKKKVKGKTRKDPPPQKRKDATDGDGNEEEQNEPKKARMLWDNDLHQRFLIAVTLLGDNAVPRKILDMMNVDGLEIKHVASHLQKHRKRVQKAAFSESCQAPHETSGAETLFPRRTASTSKRVYRAHNLDVIPKIPANPNGSSTDIEKKLMQKLLNDQFKQSQRYGIGRGKKKDQPSNSGINQLYQQDASFPNDSESGPLEWGPSLSPSFRNNCSDIPFLNDGAQMQNIYGSTTEVPDMLETFLGVPEVSQTNALASESSQSQSANTSISESAIPDAIFQTNPITNEGPLGENNSMQEYLSDAITNLNQQQRQTKENNQMMINVGKSTEKATGSASDFQQNITCDFSDPWNVL